MRDVTKAERKAFIEQYWLEVAKTVFSGGEVRTPFGKFYLKRLKAKRVVMTYEDDEPAEFTAPASVRIAFKAFRKGIVK